MQWLMTHAVPGIAYWLVAKVSLSLFAIPPSEASAVWPAAGISIAAIMLRGYRAAFGLFIACMLLYSQSWLNTDSTGTLLRSLGLMTFLSLAAVLQAVGAVWLVRRLAGDTPALIDDKSIAQFLMIIGPLASLVASLSTISCFLVLGIIQPGEFFVSWLTWWIGDSIGAMVVAPMLLAFFASPLSTLYHRRLSIGLPMAGVLLAIIVLFLQTKTYEEQERRQLFNKQAEQLHIYMQDRLNAGFEALYAVRSFFISTEHISAAEFSSFTRHKLQRYPEIKALEWIPRIEDRHRIAYEAWLDGPGKITERQQDGQMLSAPERDYYYPITFVEPMRGNEKAYGFNIASSELASAARARAELIGNVALTAPLTLVQEEGSAYGFVAYLAVEHDGVDMALSRSGIVAAVFQVGRFIKAVSGLRKDQSDGIHLQMTDITIADKPVPMSDHTEHLHNDELKWSTVIQTGGRSYRLDYYAADDFFVGVTQWSSWFVLLAGMLFTALLGGWLLSLTGRTLRVAQVVHERTVSLQHEIEERRRAEQELMKVTKAVEFSPNMVLITRADGEIEYVSPRFTEETGYAADEVVGQNINVLHFEQPGEQNYAGVWDALQLDPSWHGEIVNRKKSGVLYWAQVSIAPIFDLDGILTHFVVTLLDVTENRMINEQISYHASHDQLTALVNRREFEIRLKNLLSGPQEPGSQHAFCFLDLDQFKVVNDTCGHVAGDELLRQVAGLLQDKVRASDTLARLGGDEFGIIMMNCPLDNARTLAEAIRDEIAQFKFCWEQQVFNIGVSIGVVEMNEHSVSATEVLKQADSACYAAKDAGRNRVHLYEPEDKMLAQREGDMRWVSEINSALDEDRFMLYGQIIEPLQNPQLKPDVEILVRMLDRDGNCVPPGAFLPAAERYQLSSRIDQWVVDHAFGWLEQNFDQFTRHLGCCAINLSGGSMGDNLIKETILSRLEGSSMLPYKVKFEVTETSAIANLSEARRFINALKAYGCQFSLDDFGSGLSSFAYLKNLPVDNLKIDGMFVKDILDDKLDLAMVKSINDIGHVMGKVTIAEFVENDEIRQMLTEIGVDYGQGYGLGRPLPLDDLLQQLIELETEQGQVV